MDRLQIAPVEITIVNFGLRRNDILIHRVQGLRRDKLRLVKTLLFRQFVDLPLLKHRKDRRIFASKGGS